MTAPNKGHLEKGISYKMTVKLLYDVYNNKEINYYGIYGSILMYNK